MLSFRTGFYYKRIALVLCVSIIALVFNTGAYVTETMPWPPPVTQAQTGPSITGPMVTSLSSKEDSYAVGGAVTGELTYDGPAPSHQGPTNPPDPSVQDDPLPVVTLFKVSPSPVQEGSSLRVTLKISPPATKRIEGGVIAFDSSKGDIADALLAFVFRAGQDEVRAASYFVTDDGVSDPSRMITIMINGAFAGYRVGSPPSKVSVLDTSEVPEPTEEPTPEPTEEPTPEPTEEPTPEPTEEPTPTPTRATTPAPTPEPEEYDESGDDASNENETPGGVGSGSGNNEPPVSSNNPPESAPEAQPERPVTSTVPEAVPEPVPEPPSQVTQTSRTENTTDNDNIDGSDDGAHVGSAPTPTPTNTPIPTPTVTPTPTSTPTPTPTTAPTPTKTPTPTPTMMPTPTALPTPTQPPLPTLTPTSTPVVLATAVTEITPTPPSGESTKEALSPNLERPGLPVIGNAVPRIRNALAGIAATPRQRTTLIIILGITGIVVVIAFVYLILRRR